jgi:hypothetical protein
MKYKDSQAHELFLKENFTTVPDCECSLNPNTVLRYILIVILIALIIKSIYLIMNDN